MHVSIRREDGKVIVAYGGQETCLLNNRVIEVVYDYTRDEVRFIPLGTVLRHTMCGTALNELDTLIEDFISDIFV